MIDREHDLWITKQAEVLKISRGSVYYLPHPNSSADLTIMQGVDRLHLDSPSLVRGRTRALTVKHLIRPTSTRGPSAWLPNRGRRSTYRRGKSVQTSGTTSTARSFQPPHWCGQCDQEIVSTLSWKRPTGIGIIIGDSVARERRADQLTIGAASWKLVRSGIWALSMCAGRPS